MLKIPFGWHNTRIKEILNLLCDLLTHHIQVLTFEKKTVTSSGLGAVNGLIANTASRISSSGTLATRSAFISAITLGAIQQKKASKLLGFDDLHRFEKYSTETSPFAASNHCSTPFEPNNLRSLILVLFASTR